MEYLVPEDREEHEDGESSICDDCKVKAEL